MDTDLSEVEAAKVEDVIINSSEFGEAVRERGLLPFAKGLIEFAEWAEEGEGKDAPDWIRGN